MTSRLLLTGVLASAAVRRKRNADGAIFPVAKVNGSDRGMTREWTVFANTPTVIEQLEELRVGEPIAVAGPFSIVLAGPERDPTIQHRISAEAVVDTKRRRKSQRQIGKEERIISDEQALSAPVEEGLNDPLPF